MKASRFSDAQKAFILKQGADGIPVADICRKAGISQATYLATRAAAGCTHASAKVRGRRNVRAGTASRHRWHA